MSNDSVVSDFVLIGLSNSWEMHLFLFWFFSVFYMGIIMGNLFIVFTVIIDSHLHTPMYFLLANLSLLDLGLSSTTVPKMISDLFTDCNIISFPKCMIQIFFIHVMGGAEMMVLLIAMVFVRYVAICKPLHYLTVMNQKMCILLSVAAWIIGLAHSVIQLVFVIKLPFCGPNVLDSFYCDFPRFIKLACTDTSSLEFMVIANSGFISLGSFFILIVSYISILITVWKHSSGGSSKALSTLSTHVMVVILFFGPCIFVYIWPHPTSHLDKYLAVFDAVLTPFLNSLIYTFRNKEMKVAMRKVLCGQFIIYRRIS
uniref:G-protein coupled receptors family 1 profile domain-containing protein n=1 Tax=Suricata suricatta TaxID=37032 RepID=A0A673TAF7_SURSU